MHRILPRRTAIMNIVLTIRAYDQHVEQLFSVLDRLQKALSAAGVQYRLVGGMAVYLHVQGKNPMRARLTEDIDVAIDRIDLSAIAKSAAAFGFEYRHAAGVDLLVDRAQPKTRSAVHFVFIREKVRPEYLEPVPDFSEPVRTEEGVLLAPVEDLVRMKLTSFRLRDQVHIQDLDSVRLITPEIEVSLSSELKERLRQVRAAR
jgi:hypothetical protein